MTPELLRLRVRIIRRHTLRKIERVTYLIAGAAAILYAITRAL